MRIAIGADHAGFLLKEHLKGRLHGLGHSVDDHGTQSEEPVDYPPICLAVARAVAEGRADRGIVLGGSGQGEQIAANKVPGVRAALAWTAETAQLARQHNDANVLSLGARMYPLADAVGFAKIFVATPFSGETRHARRLAMIADFEKSGVLPPIPES